jgi:hypothetical protein
LLIQLLLQLWIQLLLLLIQLLLLLKLLNKNSFLKEIWPYLFDKAFFLSFFKPK